MKIEKNKTKQKNHPGRERCRPRSSSFSPRFHGRRDPPSGPSRAGTHSPLLLTCPTRARRTSRIDALAVGMGTLRLGVSFPLGFPSWTPKTRSPGGRKFQLGTSPSPPHFSLWLAASLARMPPSLLATFRWLARGGGSELPGSGKGNGAG